LPHISWDVVRRRLQKAAEGCRRLQKAVEKGEKVMGESPNPVQSASRGRTLKVLGKALGGMLRGAVRRPRFGTQDESLAWSHGVLSSVLREVIGFTVSLDAPAQRGAVSGLFRDPKLPKDMTVEKEAVIGGVPGLRCHPVSWAENENGPVLLHLHGGGYVIGSPETSVGFLYAMSKAAGAEVVAVDYRMAPEHPFPAAVDDAVAAYQGLLESGISPERLVLTGDSAGGGLCVALLQSLRDAHTPLPAGAVLFSPWCDLEQSGASMETNAKADYLTKEMLEKWAGWYAGETSRSDPLVSPIHADLSGLSPLLVFAGSAEVLLDDAVRLVAAVEAQGGDATLRVYDGMIHDWIGVASFLDASKKTMAETADFVAAKSK